jgi:hypothetical protein
VRRSGQPTIHTDLREVLALQADVAELRRQLNAQRDPSYFTRQPVTPLVGNQTSQGVGIIPIHHEVSTFPQAVHTHFLLKCPRRIEIEEAVWVPDGVKVADDTNYSWIDIQERAAAQNYPDSGEGWRRVGYISGKTKASGGTGNLVRGKVYHFELFQPAILQKGSLLALDGESTFVPGVWPEGYVLINYRYLD